MSYLVNTKLKPLLDESGLIHLINSEIISADTILSELIKVNVQIKCSAQYHVLFDPSTEIEVADKKIQIGSEIQLKYL